MDNIIVITDSYFDGYNYHNHGPYEFLIKQGVITSIVPVLSKDFLTVPLADDAISKYKVPFLMPGMVEAHCHLFLDGGELDFKARSAYLEAPETEMMAVARKNVKNSLDRGITLIRDAGDKYGINHSIKEEIGKRGTCQPDIRSPGLGLRRPKRYGSFMASEVETNEDIIRAIRKLGGKSDDLKIILTGIIDFKAGWVKGAPQFDLESLKLIVETAREYDLQTFAHCSGLLGLELAVEAGVASIEHGFFINRHILERMAEKKIAWVPTFSPVHFQWARPEIAGWDGSTVETLRSIIESHKTSIRLADELGVPIVAGSDAGSHGVVHGDALIDELFFLLESGLSMAAVLRSVTSTPRTMWGAVSANLISGQMANIVALGGNPFQNSQYLRNVKFIFKGSFYKVIPPQKEEAC